MKKPYIKRLTEIGGFVVWVVNGYWIRKHLDNDFTNYAQHYQFEFIPEKEFWIDLEASKRKESGFYIQSMLMMDKLIGEGMSRENAAKITGEMEELERSKSKIVQRLEKDKENKQSIIKRVHKSLLKRLSFHGIKVWLVRGDLIRALFYNDFTQGGHEFVYDFVPKGEIWIDDDLYKKDMPFVLIHELHERRLMARGMDYNSAHSKANVIEYSCRNNSAKIYSTLKRELRFNQKY